MVDSVVSDLRVVDKVVSDLLVVDSDVAPVVSVLVVVVCSVVSDLIVESVCELVLVCIVVVLFWFIGAIVVSYGAFYFIDKFRIKYNFLDWLFLLVVIIVIGVDVGGTVVETYVFNFFYLKI